MIDLEVGDCGDTFISVKQRYFASEVRMNRRENVLGWIMDLDALERLAELQGATKNTEELDLHGYKVSILAKLVGLLAETSGLEHDVPRCTWFIEFKRDLDARIKLEECDRFVRPQWSRIIETHLAPVLVVIQRETLEHVCVFKVLERI